MACAFLQHGAHRDLVSTLQAEENPLTGKLRDVPGPFHRVVSLSCTQCIETEQDNSNFLHLPLFAAPFCSVRRAKWVNAYTMQKIADVGANIRNYLSGRKASKAQQHGSRHMFWWTRMWCALRCVRYALCYVWCAPLCCTCAVCCARRVLLNKVDARR